MNTCSISNVCSISPVVIPEDVAVFRMPNPRNDVEQWELDRFDSKTIFYDVFIDSEASKVIAIGPPALNLKGYVERLGLFVNDSQVEYSFIEYEEYKLSILEASISAADEYDVLFKLDDFEARVPLANKKLASGKTVLAAISKNNEITWVSDWVDFYKSNYAIDEIYIYDNGSDNVDELERALEGRANVVRWAFPYGPPDKRFNKFAQPGALNHCLRRFAKHGVLYNFDIDELLIVDRNSLHAELEKKGTVYFNSYLVPFVNPGKPSYSHYDFVYRFADKKETARKFICRYDSVDVISQHNTWSLKRTLFWKKMRRNKPEHLQSHSAYFLHFLGITTKKQPELNRFKEVTVDNLVLDDEHVQMRP